jgi:hypothetical protein
VRCSGVRKGEDVKKSGKKLCGVQGWIGGRWCTRVLRRAGNGVVCGIFVCLFVCLFEGAKEGMVGEIVVEMEAGMVI